MYLFCVLGGKEEKPGIMELHNSTTCTKLYILVYGPL